MSQEWLWIFTIMSLVGAYMNSKGDLLTSSIIWGISNIGWLFTDLYNGIYPQAALYTCFIAMNILGIRTALKKDKEQDKHYEDFEY